MSDREVSIDPRIYGINCAVDPLTVQSIASRWGLRGVIPWTVGSSADSVLVSYPVEPSFGVLSAAGTLTAYTPVQFASLPFDYWRGTLEVRIQVVSSKYHRGRLRVSWTSTAISGSGLNESFNHIFDISDRVEHCFQIPYAAEAGYLKTPTVFGSDLGTRNGNLSIIVQNELTSPEAINDAYIVVWVRAGSDFTVAAPSHRIGTYSRFLPQSGDDDQAKDKECMVHTVIEAATGDSALDVYFGDPVLSFRGLMKRYSHVDHPAR